ncbi:hypothetical protein [Humidesulfovibrio idahonensis]
MEFFIFWIICGIAASYVAGQKGKSSGAWFVVGIFLGPIALLMVGLSPAAPAKETQSAAYTRVEPAQRKCPFCAEEIKFEAIVCKHCGRDLPVSDDLAGTQDRLPPKERILYMHYLEVRAQLGPQASNAAIQAQMEKRGCGSQDISLLLRRIENSDFNFQ